MSADIIPFDFEEQAVRVVMRGEDPWFVAADVCRVLGISNARDAVSRLDDDERDQVDAMTVGNTDGQTQRGGARVFNIINESGLYALIFTSSKVEAKRFRKWVTSEVLPALRTYGRYDMPGVPANDPGPEAGDIAGLPIRQAELWLQMVREARLSRGSRAAISVWDRSPLPPLIDRARPGQTAPGAGLRALDMLRAEYADTVAAARAGERIAYAALSEAGLRVQRDGLFVANFALPVFHGTEFGGGAHRDALMCLPGVCPARGSTSLNTRPSRGIVLPWGLFEGKNSDA
ncbi:Bro-N domain-containing protein [Marinovum algicola]|uniref:BRO-N domain-containing protein n=1 Tax=Marinovum algicola TaxID=42444 RepID=UPI003B530138